MAAKKHTPKPTPTPTPTQSEEPTPTPTPTPKKEEAKANEIEVQTTGEFGLYDPIARVDIPHEGTKMVINTSFIQRMVALKRLEEVK